MNITNRSILLACLKLHYLAVLTFSYGLATLLALQVSYRLSLREYLSLRIKLSNCLIFAGLLLAWHFIFLLCGLYKSKRLSTLRKEVVVEWRATTLATICLCLVGILFAIRMVTPVFLALFWGISSIGMVGSRLVLRSFLSQVRRKGRNLRYIVILGTNPRAIEFARRIEITPEWGYRNLGFVDVEWPGLKEFRKTGLPIVSDSAGFPEFLRSNVVDEVAIYLPLRSLYEDAARVATLCEQHGITVRFDSDIFGLRDSQVWGGEIDNEQTIATCAARHDAFSLIIKRLLDIVGSFALLTILTPLIAVVALLIKITSKGPVFFRQERVGLNKRRFLIYKFRTMVPDAEARLTQLEKFNEVSGPVFKIKNDPRITPIGTWLRRTSIDELPQLLNVLKDDMSLVGPRPLPVRDVQGFGEDWQRRRFCIRPGITCLWQVQGRNSIEFEQWMKLDMQYLDEWSLWLDFKILAMTIPAVLRGSGAA